MSYPDEWNHTDDPVETEEAIALRKCNALLLRATRCLSDKNVAPEIVNEINRLQDRVEDMRGMLLIPPAP
jgi:hypothetical protein